MFLQERRRAKNRLFVPLFRQALAAARRKEVPVMQRPGATVSTPLAWKEVRRGLDATSRHRRMEHLTNLRTNYFLS